MAPRVEVPQTPLGERPTALPNDATNIDNKNSAINASGKPKPSLGKLSPAPTAKSGTGIAAKNTPATPVGSAAKTTLAAGVVAAPATSPVAAKSATANSVSAKMGASSKSASAKGSLNLIFGVVAVVVSSAFVVYLVVSKPKPKVKTESPAAVVEKQQNNDDAWGKSYQSSPIKIYKKLSEAPKGITLYLDRKTGEYYDVRDVNEMVRTRYTKNVNDYQAVKN